MICSYLDAQTIKNDFYIYQKLSQADSLSRSKLVKLVSKQNLFQFKF
jgi:hypothetical protein